jgi:hypothetical protein
VKVPSGGVEIRWPRRACAGQRGQMAPYPLAVEKCADPLSPQPVGAAGAGCSLGHIERRRFAKRYPYGCMLHKAGRYDTVPPFR